VSDQDRLDRLERRVLQLETLMRRLLQEGPAAPVTPAPAEEPAPAAPAPSLDGEQWVGQRGLLAVGVVAVVLAAGYLLKLSFDRGWISPVFRCIGGGVTGLAVAFLFSLGASVARAQVTCATCSALTVGAGGADACAAWIINWTRADNGICTFNPAPKCLPNRNCLFSVNVGILDTCGTPYATQLCTDWVDAAGTPLHAELCGGMQPLNPNAGPLDVNDLPVACATM